MWKAPARELNDDVLYDGMIMAYTMGNIGPISNKITKIWNSPEPDLEAIKQLCCFNNYTIDAAKTLVAPTFPKDIQKHLNELTSGKLPHFFIHAKGKTNEQCKELSNSCTDKLESIVRSYKFNFQKKQLGYFDYKILMDNPELEITDNDKELIQAYYKIASTTNIKINDDENGTGNYNLIFDSIREELLKIDPDINHLVDVLVKQTFFVKKSKHKVILWYCFGEEIYNNISRNLPKNTLMCECCGKRVPRTSPRQTRCKECAEIMNRKRYVKYNHTKRKQPTF